MDTQTETYQFILGWILMLTILVLISKTRLGYVIVYYSLLLMILLILVTEYQQFAPLIAGIQTIGQYNQAAGGDVAETAAAN